MAAPPRQGRSAPGYRQLDESAEGHVPEHSVEQERRSAGQDPGRRAAQRSLDRRLDQGRRYRRGSRFGERPDGAVRRRGSGRDESGGCAGGPAPGPVGRGPCRPASPARIAADRGSSLPGSRGRSAPGIWPAAARSPGGGPATDRCSPRRAPRTAGRHLRHLRFVRRRRLGRGPAP